METQTYKRLQAWAHGVLAMVLLIGASVPVAQSSSWDPTLLVNTESFVEIDEGDGTTDVELYFGTTERLYYDRSEDSFVFTKGLNVTGTVTGSSLAGTDLAGCTNVTSDATGKLICSDGSEFDSRFVNVSGDTMTGALTISNGAGLTASGNITTQSDFSADGDLTIDADDSGTPTLNFGTSETLVFNGSEFVFSDDLNITGNLDVDGTTNLDGAVTINDNLTVANDTNLNTLTATGAVDFDSTLNVDGIATFNNNVDINGDASVSGTLSGNALNVDTGSVTINGVSYNVTNTQGGANTVLTNDGLGNLTWQSSAIADGSGSFMSIHPQYPNTVYQATGATSVGSLRIGSDNTNDFNYYRWATTRATQQRYDIVTRVQVPENFDSWAVANALELNHRTNSALNTANSVRVAVYDTTGAFDYDTGELTTVAGAWAVENVTAANLGGTYTAGGYMTVRITVEATTGNAADVGYLNFNWITTTP